MSWPSCWVKGCKAFWHPAFLFKIAISWSTYVLQIQVKWHHNILETLRYIIDMPVITLMIVSVPTCRCVFWLYKCTHTSWGLYSPSPALFVSWASFTKRGCRQHFLCFLFGEKTKGKKKKHWLCSEGLFVFSDLSALSLPVRQKWIQAENQKFRDRLGYTTSQIQKWPIWEGRPWQLAVGSVWSEPDTII